MTWQRITATVVKGHGAASGVGKDPRYPDGTLALQEEHFKALGLDLGSFHRATLNVSIAPLRYEVRRPRYTFRQVRWSTYIPPEDFSFFDCRIIPPDGVSREGLIYYPHPDTKPEHFQDPHVLEVMTSPIPEVRYGIRIDLELDPAQIHVTPE